jgi:DNA-directed RNA polymerase beta' subunit
MITREMEDDLTHKLIDILRANDKVREKIDKEESAEVLDKYTAKLQYDVATYVDNDIKGLEPSAQRSGRPSANTEVPFWSQDRTCSWKLDG